MTRYGILIILPIIIAMAILGVALLRFFRLKNFRPRKKKDTSIKIAHTSFVRNLPEYKAARKRYNALLVIAMILFATSLGSLSFLVARPVNVTESTAEKENRDIVFCLDVSLIKNDYIAELLDYYGVLLDKMDGERFGITIFDGTFATIAPLSDDYNSLRATINDIKNNYEDYRKAINKYVDSDMSKVGVGLAGCVDSFDKLGETQRSRSIILTTDNHSSSEEAISIMEAAQYAKDNDITVYGVNAGDITIDDSLIKYNATALEFRDAVLLTSGAYYSVHSDDDAKQYIPEIADKIQAQETAKYDGAGQLIYTDTPEIAAIISLVSLTLFLIIIWRLYI